MLLSRQQNNTKVVNIMTNINNLLTAQQIEGLEYSIRKGLSTTRMERVEGKVVYSFETFDNQEQLINARISEMHSMDFGCIGEVFSYIIMTLSDKLNRWAKRLSYNMPYESDELFNASYIKIVGYDFETKWSEGIRLLSQGERFLSDYIGIMKNEKNKMDAKNGRNKGIKSVVIETKTFDNLSNDSFQLDEQGTVLEYSYKEYHSKKAVASKGFLSMEFDNKEQLIDLKSLLTDIEFKAFKLYREGYKVREIQAQIKDGRRVYDRMKNKVEEYYAQYCYELDQSQYVIKYAK